MKLPQKLSSAQAYVTKEIWNDLIDYIRSLQIVPSVNIMPRVTSQGTYLVGYPNKSKSSSSDNCSFSIKATGKGDPDPTTGLYNTYSAQVMAGSINSVLPTNWWDSGAKALTKFDYGKDSLQYVYLDVKADSTGILSCEIKVNATLPAAQKGVKGAPPTQFNVTLGILFNDSVYPIMEGAIRASTSVLYAEYDGAGKMEATCIWIAYSSGCCSGSSADGSGNDTGSGGDGSGFGGYG